MKKQWKFNYVNPHKIIILNHGFTFMTELLLKKSMKKSAILLAGIPRCGKSTVADSLKRFCSLYEIIGTDDIVTELSAAEGLTYNEGFSKYIKHAGKIMDEKFNQYLEAGTPIIVDRTNTMIHSRRRFMKGFEKYGYNVRCFWFRPDVELSFSRWDCDRESGKTINKSIIQNMANKFEEPTIDEGFSLVFRVN